MATPHQDAVAGFGTRPDFAQLIAQLAGGLGVNPPNPQDAEIKKLIAAGYPVGPVNDQWLQMARDMMTNAGQSPIAAPSPGPGQHWIDFNNQLMQQQGGHHDQLPAFSAYLQRQGKQ